MLIRDFSFRFLRKVTVEDLDPGQKFTPEERELGTKNGGVIRYSNAHK